jgi:hypothetical protein
VQAQFIPIQAPKTTLEQVAPQPDPAKDTIPEIVVEEHVEVLPPMEPVEVEVEEPVDVEVLVEVDTVFPGFDATVEFDVQGFTDMADAFIEFNPVEDPSFFISPDVMVDVEQFVDMDYMKDVLADVQIQLDDTTRERIMKALEEQRKALELARVEQEKALEKAREQLRESLKSDRPDELSEEEWEMAKEKIEQAEHSLERAMERSSRELERALELREYDVHKHLDKQRDMESNRIVLRHVQRDREWVQEDMARAHRHAKQYSYRWDRGNEADLRQSMLKDGLIDEYDSDISLSFSKSQIKVNGIKLEGSVKEKYRKMLDEMYGESSTGSLSFSR